MTPYALLLALSGLSQREAAEFHRVRLDTVKSWSAGRNASNSGVVADLCRLIAAQERAAREASALIADKAADVVEIGYPADDAEARALGFPAVSAWSAMAARAIAAYPERVRLVPRGSTAASSAANTAQSKQRQPRPQ